MHYPWPMPGRERDTAVPKREARKTRTFSGQENEESWEDFDRHYLATAEWNRWGDDDKARGLYLALKGPAADYVYSHPGSEHAGYDELRSLLEARFGAENCLASDRRKLRDRTKQKGETYRALGQDIQKLARRVFKGAPDLIDREGRDSFIRALPPDLKVAVAVTNPRTVDECMAHMDRLCAVLDTVDGGDPKKIRWADSQASDSQPQSAGTGANDGTSGNGNQNKGNKKGQNNRGNQNRKKKASGSRGPVICWDCGQQGHARTKCPEHFKFKPKDGTQGANPPPPEEEGNEQGTQ